MIKLIVLFKILFFITLSQLQLRLTQDIKSQSTIQSINNFKKYSKSKCIAQQKLTVIPRTQEYSQNRLLQGEQTHGYRIYGSFPADGTQTAITDWKAIQRTFKIAVKYFNTVIKVTKLTKSQTLFSSGDTCGNTAITQSMKTNGFDPDALDSYVFVQGVSDQNLGFAAQAAPCLLTRWVVYGFIRFNQPYMEKDLQNKGSFHNGIFTVVHQLSHVLVVNPTLFQYYYTAYQSNVTLGQSNVIANRPGYTGVYMIITPNVKNYIAGYFNCNDTTVGAVLQDEGGNGTQNSHWDRKVYYNQLMTGSVWPSGLKITPLTLNLYKDSGFYHTIDTTLSDSPLFGKGKGCDFAKGDINPTRQFCTGTSDDCGFNYNYIGKCASDDPFANSASYVKAYQNMVCNNPDLNGSDPNVFDPFSRCFKLQSGNLYCFKSNCTQNGVQIQINDRVIICGNGDTTINSPLGTLYCPDYTIFCSVKSCINWCGTKGLCINGLCINQTSLPDTLAQVLNWNVSQQFIISISVTAGIIILVFIIICCVGRANAKNKQQEIQKLSQNSNRNNKSRQFIKTKRYQEGENQ